MTRGNFKNTVFFVLVAAFLLVIVTKQLTVFLPDTLSPRVGHNSESLAFALLVCASIQWLRPVLLRRANPWVTGVPIAVAGYALGLLLESSSLPPSVVTLNEPLIAASPMVLYILLPRPLRVAPLIGVAVLALTILFFDTSYVLDQAESLVPLMLAPFALDVFDRTILEPEQPDRPGLRAAWIAILLVLGLGFIALAPGAREDLHGFLRYAIDYGQRASEAYWGWLLVHFYFSYLLGKDRTVEPEMSALATSTRRSR